MESRKIIPMETKGSEELLKGEKKVPIDLAAMTKEDMKRWYCQPEGSGDVATGLTEGSSLSKNYSDQGWQGTSAQTFRAFIRKIAQDLKVDQYQDIEGLNDAIHEIYEKNNDQYNCTKEEEEQYKESLNDNLEKIFDNNEELKQIKFKEKKGYGHFMHAIKVQPDEMRGRYSLNIDPDMIPMVGPEMVQEIAILPYVYDMKIASNIRRAKRRLDNIIIFFYNSADGKNKEQLEQILRSYKQHSRLGHPAMLEQIDLSIHGIVYADQGKAAVEGTGWGTSRIKHIADIILELKLKGEEITFEKLLSRVQERFRENNIDPERPYRDLPETETTIASNQAG